MSEMAEGRVERNEGKDDVAVVEFAGRRPALKRANRFQYKMNTSGR